MTGGSRLDPVKRTPSPAARRLFPVAPDSGPTDRFFLAFCLSRR